MHFRKHRLVVLAFLMAGVAGAQEPKLPTGPCEFSKSDPFVAAEKCKALADAGDADALFQFGIMLLMNSPEPGRASTEEITKWKPLGNRYTAKKWLDAAADKGSVQAMELKCRLASDQLAPRDTQEEGEKWCRKLKAAR